MYSVKSKVKLDEPHHKLTTCLWETRKNNPKKKRQPVTLEEYRMAEVYSTIIYCLWLRYLNCCQPADILHLIMGLLGVR